MTFTFELLADTFAISRLAFDAPIPDWADGDFISITRTPEELSIVCPQKDVPNNVESERGWRCLRIVGKLDFALVGVLATITETLADAGLSVFVVSTYETDYLLVRQIEVERAVRALGKAGHSVNTDE